MKINNQAAMKVLYIVALAVTIDVSINRGGFLGIFNFLLSLVVMFFLYQIFKEDRE